MTQKNTDLTEEVRVLRDRLKEENDKYHNLWRMNCENLAEYAAEIAKNEAEITQSCCGFGGYIPHA